MVIGTLALLLFFLRVAVMKAGQRPWREPEGTKSLRIQGESVRPSGVQKDHSGLREVTWELRELILGLREVTWGLRGPLKF